VKSILLYRPNIDAAFGPQSNALRRLLLACIAAAIPLLAGCAVRTFPNVPSAKEPSREYFSSAKAENYFIRARDYERRGLMPMAERFYELAYELDPASATLRTMLLLRYSSAGKYEQAIALARRSASDHPLADDDLRILSGVYLKLGEYARAAEEIDRIHDKSPDEWYSLGLIYESMGIVSKSILSFRRCLDLRPESLPVGCKIASLYLRVKNYFAAESLYIALENRFPRRPVLINGLGIVQLAKGDTNAALGFFKTASTIDSTEYEEPLRNAAQIYTARGDYRHAVECYERLYGLDGSGEMYWRTLSFLYYYNKQYDKAFAILSRLLSNNVNDQELHFYLGLSAAALDSNDRAEMEFEKAIVLDPGYGDAWTQLCWLSIKRKEYDAAMLVTDRFRRAMPRNSAAWRLTGHVQGLRKEYAAAETALKKSISLDSTDAASWFDYGSLLERQKKTSAAAEAFRKVLAFRPRDPGASNYLGYMWAEQGANLDSAQVLLEQALAAEPDNGAFLDSYAWIFYKKGDYDKAMAYIRKAVDKIGNDAVVFDHLGDILEKKGDRAGAAAAYEKSLQCTWEDPDSAAISITRKKLEGLNHAPAPAH